MIATLAQFHLDPCNTWHPLGFIRQIQLSEKSILRYLGVSVEVILDFWEKCNQERVKVASALQTTYSSPPVTVPQWTPGAAPRSGLRSGTINGTLSGTINGISSVGPALQREARRPSLLLEPADQQGLLEEAR